MFHYDLYVQSANLILFPNNKKVTKLYDNYDIIWSRLILEAKFALYCS